MNRERKNGIRAWIAERTWRREGSRSNPIHTAKDFPSVDDPIVQEAVRRAVRGLRPVHIITVKDDRYTISGGLFRDVVVNSHAKKGTDQSAAAARATNDINLTLHELMQPEHIRS